MALPTREEIEATSADPKSLFKFYGFNRNALACLIGREVWLANPASLNDPFDMFIPPTSEADFAREREALARINKAQAKPLSDEGFAESWAATRDTLTKLQEVLPRCGIFSMSATPYELLLWSHYADNHRGFCIQYERRKGNVLGEKAQQVVYSSKRPISLLRTLGDTGSITACVEAVVTTKAPCWAYEKEWRLVYPLNEGERTLALTGPPLGTRIQSVILGMRIDEEHIRTLIHAFRGGPEIEFHKMRMDPQRYEVEPFPVAVDWERAEIKAL